jgi:type I restriction enzyme S subunit
MSFPRYPAYFDSAVDWLGMIPQHWRLLPAKRGFRREKQLNTGMVCENRLALTMGGVVPRALDDLEGLQASEFETYQIFQQDDLAFKLIDLQNIKTSRVGLVPEYGIMSPAYIRLRPYCDLIQPKFAYWFFTDLYNRQVFNQLGGGVRQTIGPEELLVMPILFPPTAEQEQIGKFLDHETAKIDALVAEQERLIELLKEKRQAVISHAVTKGLDPSVPMKDSGVEWLGEVPEHWSVSALSYLASIETGSTPDRGNPSYWNGAIPWLKTGEINWEPIREAEEFISEAGLANSAAKLSKPGTLLMAMYGQGVTRGRVALLEIEATYNQACAAITFGPRVLPSYARYFFMAAYEYVREGGNETSQMNLSAGLIAKFRVSVPPAEEQSGIVRFLDIESRRLDVLMSEAVVVIDLLRERRTALISAAVTGQIDVRGWEPTEAVA